MTSSTWLHSLLFFFKNWKWGYLTVVLTLFLITFLPISSQVWIFYSAYPPFKQFSYFVFHITFDICIFNLYINYFLTMRTHPGTVPPHWVPPWITNASHAGDLIEVKKSAQKPRFCRTCNRYKPPRSHHCRQCEQCILKMDHHCPWVNNCVGHFNYAYFLRFLLFVDLSTSLCCLGLIHQCYLTLKYNITEPIISLILLFINTPLCLGTWLIVGGLSLYHFYYLFTNATTIEAIERDRQAYFMVDGSTVPLANMYNIDWKTNLKTVFGDGPVSWTWLFYGVTTSSGLHFKYRKMEDDIPLSQLYPKKVEGVDKKSD